MDSYDGVDPISVPDDIIQTGIGNPVPSSEIVQDGYGIDEIKYQVRLESPELLVENEVYFPDGSHSD